MIMFCSVLFDCLGDFLLPYFVVQSPVMIGGDTAISFGETLQLECLLSDGSFIPFRPQWSKDSGSLPGNATLV